MIRFYSGSGSQEIEVLDMALQPAEWARVKALAIQLLEAKSHYDAASFLRDHEFLLCQGTNSFCDDFLLLYMKVPVSSFVEITELALDPSIKACARQIATAMAEVGKSIRFIAAELDTNGGTPAVVQPTLESTTETVERALRDAESLIASQGATSAVDRVHTAFHGYLRALARRSGLQVDETAGITVLFRQIREQHSAFTLTATQRPEIEKVLRSLSNVVDTLSPLRNHASVAHPNDALLAEPEAMLVINSVKTLLHYINEKTR